MAGSAENSPRNRFTGRNESEGACLPNQTRFETMTEQERKDVLDVLNDLRVPYSLWFCAASWAEAEGRGHVNQATSKRSELALRLRAWLGGV